MSIRGSVINVFTELQVAVFPDVKDTLQCQLTATIAGTLNDYFFPTEVSRPKRYKL